ncbi:hypothetical protein [Shinella zoogloeoides]|uniref:hypothetical protein n=1 Tax=Shinella zoogloeoides TaxID=352475 RepID=UPI001F582673|nr:hypothetical protein [Shinella zoogloeoides]
MEYEDMRAAVLAALEDHSQKQSPRLGAIMRIEPFEAETADDEPCRAIGVVVSTDGDCLDFVVIKEVGDGELIPTTEGSLWKREKAA